MKNVRMKGIMIRIVVVLVLSIIIWNLIAYLNDTFIGQEYNPLSHFIIALITAVLAIILIQVLLRTDKTSWKIVGQSTLKTNTFSFLLGLLLWTIPAMIGLLICLMFGWVEITVYTNFNTLLLSILILFVTVFLIEALPEELIFRGYIYRYLNALFPHWSTIILQALLFTVFAYLIGAIYSVEQLQFIPGFAIILGVFRAISGNVWTSIGFHTAIMTATQILGPIHGHFNVNGFLTLQFIAFILLPSAIGATLLSFINPKYNWNNKTPLN
ncbi:CPBP family intramembrane glutamic endopeptidase [Paucisalibacillus globulus]|uniref:CPBP family intramembrane glutamic endopeptidase n=1 Tax=Paucisalibacillus globulus TaxID=351095 RepID=UPI000BB7BE4D|nr:type II CAAX endopeptidase family protein [Paucisalibacillus globulus]